MIVTASVLVPADVAAELVQFANAGRDRVRARDGYRMSGPCEQTLAELQAVARATRVHLATTRAERGTSGTVLTISSTEFAKRNGISPQAVTERLRRGTIPGARVNGKWRIYESEEDIK